MRKRQRAKISRCASTSSAPCRWNAPGATSIVVTVTPTPANAIVLVDSAHFSLCVSSQQHIRSGPPAAHQSATRRRGIPDARRGRFVVRRRPVAGLRRGEVGAWPAHAGVTTPRWIGPSMPARSSARTSAAHLALRRAGRHPLDARADRAASARAHGVLLPSERPRREDVFARSRAIFERALRGGTYLTRASWRAPQAGGHRCARRAPGTSVMHEELDGVICSGPGGGSSSPTRCWTSAFRRRRPSARRGTGGTAGATSRATARPRCVTSSGGPASP